MKGFYYQIGTENKRKEELAEMLCVELKSFTIVKGLGCWQGVLERAISINFALFGSAEICDALAERLARKVRAFNKQEAVILIKTAAHIDYIYAE